MDDRLTPEGDPNRPISEMEQRLFGGKQPAPPPPKLAQIARDFANRATLRFKGFRQDYERVSNAATALHKDGLITKAEAQRIFLDDAYMISAPLIERYIIARESEQVANWLRARTAFHFPNWLDERNRMALDGFVANGEGALAVQLIRQHLHKIMNRTKDRWRDAGRKRPKDLAAQYHESFEDRRLQALEELPGHLDIAVYEIAELEPWVTGHGSKEDLRAVAGYREEIQKIRGRFNLS
ncbi:hypothetical protein [Altererythrobacter aquiaggeris]|uniref:hypothetical protein n=1 Tax=Aestuarierythrobacter aquiaggeris TaxID=1898396 RepID=UPI003015F5A5